MQRTLSHKISLHKGITQSGYSCSGVRPNAYAQPTLLAIGLKRQVRLFMDVAFTSKSLFTSARPRSRARPATRSRQALQSDAVAAELPPRPVHARHWVVQQ